MQKYLVGAKPARKATNIEVHINRKLATDQTILCVCVCLQYLENGEKCTVKKDHYMGQWYMREM